LTQETLETASKTFNHVSTRHLPSINRVNIDGKRHYTTPAGELISITSLLSSSVPDAIKEWRKNVGDDVANYVMRTAANRGNKVHKLVEAYLSNRNLGNILLQNGVLATGLFNLMKPALNSIDNVRKLEQPLYSTNLGVAGTTDCIADFEGQVSVIDFKTASKMRDGDLFNNYMLQTTFYSIAWNELTGEQIDQIVILMVSEDGKMRATKDKPKNYVAELKSLIENWRNENS
jgi:hypothetical protein